MIKPPELNTERGEQIWAVITAAASGNTATLRRLVERDPSLSREGYFYTPPIHFAVREGHRATVEILLAAGADSEWNGYYGISLIDMAKERGHDDIAAILEKTCNERGRAAPSGTGADPFHAAAESGNVQRVRALLDADPTLIDRADHAGGTPLHRAVIGRARDVVILLLDRGANIHAIHGTGAGAGGGYWPRDIQAIDLAIWGGRRRTIRPPLWRIVMACLRSWTRSAFRAKHNRPCDIETARLLLNRGATYDLTIAAALGDMDRVKAILDLDPSQIRNARPNGRRAPRTVHSETLCAVIDRAYSSTRESKTQKHHAPEPQRPTQKHTPEYQRSRSHTAMPRDLYAVRLIRDVTNPPVRGTDARICELRRKMSKETLAQLGPLAALAGVWEGDKGDDIAPADDRTMIERNQYRERMTFEPIKPVQNHEQTLYGLRYSTVAWRIGETDAFHEELGYWLWDPSAGQVMRCFMVPRGVTVIAGGSAKADAKTFSLAADRGSPTYGICSNKFLDENFKTVRYELTVTFHNENSFSYDEDTILQIPGQTELFHHRDKHTLTRAR